MTDAMTTIAKDECDKRTKTTLFFVWHHKSRTFLLPSQNICCFCASKLTERTSIFCIRHRWFRSHLFTRSRLKINFHFRFSFFFTSLYIVLTTIIICSCAQNHHRRRSMQTWMFGVHRQHHRLSGCCSQLSMYNVDQAKDREKENEIIARRRSSLKSYFYVVLFSLHHLYIVSTLSTEEWTIFACLHRFDLMAKKKRKNKRNFVRR